MTPLIQAVQGQLLECSNIEINSKIYNKAKEFIFSGRNVIIDTVANNEELGQMWYIFNRYPISKILLYCSLKSNLEKCLLRNYLSFQCDVYDFRPPEWIIKQYLNFYRFKTPASINKVHEAEVLEEVDKIGLKNTLKNILKFSKSFSHSFFAEGKGSNDKQLIKQINKVYEDMHLNTCERLFVIAEIEFDRVIQSHLIENIDFFNLAEG